MNSSVTSIHVAMSAEGDIAVATTDKKLADQIADIRNSAAGKKLYAVISPSFNLDRAKEMVTEVITNQ